MGWPLSCPRDESARPVTARKHKIALRKPHLDHNDETKCDEPCEQAKASSAVTRCEKESKLDAERG
jgi:hypothetical protein